MSDGGKLSLFVLFFRLGLISFGGPTAHLAFFRKEFVEKKRWLEEEAYANLVALCQMLPGPASSQVGMAVGYLRGGWTGAILAWIGFTMPAAILLTSVGYGLSIGGLASGWLLGFKLAAFVIVAEATRSMWKQLCPNLMTKVFAFLSFALLVLSDGKQITVLLIGTFLGILFFRKRELPHWQVPIKSSSPLFSLFLFFAFLLLLVFSPFFATLGNIGKAFYIFYTSGALVFGGGHVVLPLLENQMVALQWISQDHFLAGYGITQAMPGPLFGFSAYLGTFVPGFIAPWVGALACLFFLFLPSFLILFGVLPFLKKLEKWKSVSAGVVGINASVVGLLLFALYDQMGVSVLTNWKELILFLFSYVMYRALRLPPWALVLALGAFTRFVFVGG